MGRDRPQMQLHLHFDPTYSLAGNRGGNGAIQGTAEPAVGTSFPSGKQRHTIMERNSAEENKTLRGELTAE